MVRQFNPNEALQRIRHSRVGMHKTGRDLTPTASGGHAKEGNCAALEWASSQRPSLRRRARRPLVKIRSAAIAGHEWTEKRLIPEPRLEGGISGVRGIPSSPKQVGEKDGEWLAKRLAGGLRQLEESMGNDMDDGFLKQIQAMTNIDDDLETRLSEVMERASRLPGKLYWNAEKPDLRKVTLIYEQLGMLNVHLTSALQSLRAYNRLMGEK
mgnify:CR=1 FL=1